MITKTLGGSRLGSGSKMKVSMHGYERSTHNMNRVFRNTQAPGTLVPFFVDITLPGDTWDINLDAYCLTHPTVGPLFGSFKLQLDVFTCPMRLYNSWLHNNRMDIGRDISQIKFPIIRLEAAQINPSSAIPPEFQQINQSALLAYCGIRGVAGLHEDAGNIVRYKNALPLVAYYDIFKNYYANKQEEVGYYIHNEEPTITVADLYIPEEDTTYDLTTLNQSGVVTFASVLTLTGKNLKSDIISLTQHLSAVNHAVLLKDIANQIEWNADGTIMTATGFVQSTVPGPPTGTDYTLSHAIIDQSKYPYDSAPTLKEFPLENIDLMRDDMYKTDGDTAYCINDNAHEIIPYIDIADIDAMKYPQQGLCVKTFQSDIFNNWLNSEFITGLNGIAAVTAISTAGGSFTLDTFNISKKIYEMLTRITVSGGTYADWQEVQYDHKGIFLREIPEYEGGLIKQVVFQEVISTVEASKEKPLGTLAGRGTLSGKHKGGNIIAKINEPGIIMGIVSLTPIIDYTQGNMWWSDLQNMGELHVPALDGIGFQDAITEKFHFADTKTMNNGSTTRYSAGKQPAWIDYMTSFNQAYGNFADSRSQMHMILGRRYSLDTNCRISDLTTYIEPNKFNYAFAITDLSAQNFLVQIGIDATVRRKMSYKIIPNI